MKSVLAALMSCGCAAIYAQSTPSVIQSNVTGTSNWSNTLSFSANVTTGHALYATMYDAGGAGDSLTFTDTQGNIWTTVKTESVATDLDTVAIGCAIAGASAVDTVTFQVNGSAGPYTLGSVYEVANATCTPDVTPAASDALAQTACNSGPLTTTTANDLLVGLCGLAGSSAPASAGSGWSYAYSLGAWGNNLGLSELRIGSTPGAYTATSATYSPSGEQATIEVAFKATASGGGGAITGSGTANTVPLFTASSTLGNSAITQSGGNVGIGTTTPNAPLQINSTKGLIVGNRTYNFPNGSADEAVFAGNIALQNMSLANWVGIEFKGGNLYSSPSMSLGYSPSAGSNGQLQFLNGSGVPIMAIDPNGYLHMPDGTVQMTAWTGVLCGGDYAEAVNASGGRKEYGPGDVLVLGDGHNGDVEKSAEPYSTMVAGIYATKPGVIGKRQSLATSSEDIPMAMVGIVPTKVDTENGAIHRGDLLVTSSIPGYAMKGTDRSRLVGAVIGKAMGVLDSGTGTIEVLVTLQ
jgi:hypothetical protein